MQSPRNLKWISVRGSNNLVNGLYKPTGMSDGKPLYIRTETLPSNGNALAVIRWWERVGSWHILLYEVGALVPVSSSSNDGATSPYPPRTGWSPSMVLNYIDNQKEKKQRALWYRNRITKEVKCLLRKDALRRLIEEYVRAPEIAFPRTEPIDKELEINTWVESGVALALAAWKLATENSHKSWEVKKAESRYASCMGTVLDRVKPFLEKPWEEE